MIPLLRENCHVAVHVHADFRGDAIIMACHWDEVTRSIQIPVQHLLDGNFSAPSGCELTEIELRIATSITLQHFMALYPRRPENTAEAVA